ncbi:unnamed protein product, partial [Coregonus sp. 'balchen']
YGGPYWRYHYLECSNVTTVVGHTAWFKQVNGSEPVCISSMYGFNSTPDLHYGFQRSHFEMFSNNTTGFLTITKVEIADCGLYFCGLYPHSHMFFVNAKVLKYQGPPNDVITCHLIGHCNGTISLVGEEVDGTMYLLPLVVILGVVTAVLLIVILILVLKIRREAKAHNTGRSPFHDNMGPVNYTSNVDVFPVTYCTMMTRRDLILKDNHKMIRCIELSHPEFNLQEEEDGEEKREGAGPPCSVCCYKMTKVALRGKGPSSRQLHYTDHF